MNLIKRIALGTAAMAAVAAPLTTLTASAKGGERPTTKQECRQLRRDQQKIIDHIYFGNSWQLKKFQNLTDMQNAQNCAPRFDTADYLERFGNFESLTAALKYTGLYKTLEGPGPFTVFAPTDDAFAKLPPALVQSLLTDPAQKAALTDILLYHVVPGAKVEAATAKTLTSAVMADGKTVTIKQQGGKLFINDSQVVLYDIRTTNGVIHVIDTVLVP